MKRVRSVVIDEADQLMKSDFQDQILSLFSQLTSRCLQVITVTRCDSVEDYCVGNNNGESAFTDSSLSS